MEKKEVLILDADENQSKSLTELLDDHQYCSKALNSLVEFECYAKQHKCRALILNLDNVAITNKVLKELKRKIPQMNIIAQSERQFHPELEEALTNYISVCLSTPVDPDELFYWLRAVFENGQDLND